MKTIVLKYPGKCSDTGKKLRRGEIAYFDKSTKKIYSINSPKAREIIECINTKLYVEAQENSYFDNFYSLNYSNF